jgi:hypothetical protein
LSGTNALSASNDVSPGAETDIGQTLDSGLGSGTQFLSASDTTPSLQTLSPDTMQSLGLDPSSIAQPSLDTSMSGSDLSAMGEDNPGYGPMNVASQSGGLGSWLSNAKNVGTAGMLGLSLKNALSKPKLTSADATASAAATDAVKSADAVINSGGTATAEWGSQKASIDATINQQIQQQTEAIQQAAANSGQGNQNSGIVQQQIAQMTANANTQRQTLYSQQQQANVSAALSELSSGDATLTSIGNAELKQSEEAQQLAAQTAELALQLQTGTATKQAGAGS